MKKLLWTTLVFSLCFTLFRQTAFGAVNVNVNFISGYYGVPEQTAVVYEQRLGNWEDAATLFFLSRLTGTSPHLILDWRLGGTPWVGIVQRLNVPVSDFYVPVGDEDDFFAFHQGPPYGHAWGYWKHGPGGRTLVLTDNAIRQRVVLLGTSHFYGIAPAAEIEAVANNRESFEGLVKAHEKEGRHGPPFSQEAGSHGRWNRSRGQAGGREHGKGRGQGHENPGGNGENHGRGNGENHGRGNGENHGGNGNHGHGHD